MTLPVDDVELGSEDLRTLAAQVAELFANEVLDPPTDTLRFASAEHIEALLPPLRLEGSGGPALISLLRDGLLGHTRSYRHPRHFGHQRPAPLAASSLASLVADGLNTGPTLFEHSPYAVVIEKRLVRWMADQAGFPADAGGSFVTGGAESNLSALLCARDAAARKARQDGRTVPRKIIASADAHYSVARAAHILGLGDDGLIRIPLDERGAMNVSLLNQALLEMDARSERPIAIVGTAATTSRGAFDDLQSLSRLARAHDTWLHVDGAHGGSLLLSPRFRGQLAGIENADSLTWDPHKMMFVAAGCSVVLIRRRRDLKLAMAPGLMDASYVVRNPDLVFEELDKSPDDPIQWTLAVTRSLSAIKVYAALLVYGQDALRRRIERCCDLAEKMWEQVGATSDFEALCQPEMNIFCFRHVPVALRDDEEALNRHNFKLREVLTVGRFGYLTGTRAKRFRAGAGVTSYWLRAVPMTAAVSEVSFAEVLEELRRLADTL